MTAPAERRTPSKALLPIAAAAAIAATYLTAPSEGLATKPYWDPSHIRTVCYGETLHVQERAYSRAECSVLLRDRLAREYAPTIERCLPQLRDDRRVKIFAAFLDAAYNAGAGRVCQSRMAVALRGGTNLEAVCKLFDGWFTTSLNRKTGRRIQLRGLETRRKNEMKLCLEGASA